MPPIPTTYIERNETFSEAVGLVTLDEIGDLYTMTDAANRSKRTRWGGRAAAMSAWHSIGVIGSSSPPITSAGHPTIHPAVGKAIAVAAVRPTVFAPNTSSKSQAA